MSQENKVNLAERFPKMRPIKTAPRLMTINGIGCTMWGKRDLDPETGAYVKTHCVTFLFIPLLALGAYRVVDSPERGWYFLGREPLSGFARTWNYAVAFLSICLGLSLGHGSYTSSPQYRAQQDLKRAETSLAAHQPARAAGLFRPLIHENRVAEPAQQGLKMALEQCLQGDRPADMETAFQIIAGLPARLKEPTPLVPKAFERGLALVEKFRPSQPDPALNLLAKVSALEPTNQNLGPLQVALLKETIAQAPAKTNRVVELALIYEKERQMDDCFKLLAPYRQKLGATEGARILGQQLLSQGEHEEAYGLLFPYVQGQLHKLHAIERSYTNAYARASEAAIESLRHNGASAEFYTRYEKAGKVAKEELVSDYIQKWQENDATLKRALAELQAANQIVHVTLDLGLVQLNRAQGMRDPAARKAELEAAEKTFLAIRGLAGETDGYRLFLGQVYYWLGRSEEGKELFDQLLASSKRAFPVLMRITETLREVGDHAQARALAEEAYAAAKEPKQKYAAASMRAHIQRDTDDQIKWFELADPEDNTTQISLNNARGDKALAKGDKKLAAEYLRKTIDGYQKQPKSTSTLNNGGLACLTLFNITGDVRDHTRGLAMLEEAVSLAPGDSILLGNTMHNLFYSAVGDVVRDRIKVDLLGEKPYLGMLGHLYDDEATRLQVYQRLRENEKLKKCLTYLDKALLLAPKSFDLYQQGLQIHTSFRDLAELQKLQQRLKVTVPDFSENIRTTKEMYSGTKDKENLEKTLVRIRKAEELLQSAAVKEHPLTLECVTTEWLGLNFTAVIHGGQVDGRKLLGAARTSYDQHPSASSRGMLREAHLFQAHQELAQQNADYAALASRYRRALPPRSLMILMLDRGGPLAEAIRQNGSFKEALALEKESARRFPTFCSIDDWALFRTVDAAEAAAIAGKLQEDKPGKIADELQSQLYPMSATLALERYWSRKVTGDEKGAAEVYAEAIRSGVPLPAL